MQVKTYTARNMTEALGLIKADLGPEAIILDNREQDGLVTVTAALERETLTAQPDAPGSMPPGWEAWQQEWQNIKHHLMHLMKPALNMEKLPSRQRLAMEYLQGQGICDEAVLALYDKLKADPEESILGPLAGIVATKAWSLKNWPQRFHVLAGPFGSGKTTVAVRLALNLRKKNPNLRICLINADATRGNGRLLLKHYADLSDFAYKEAASSMELVAALTQAEEEGFDRVLVDLPGLGKNVRLADLLDGCGISNMNAAVHLVLPPHYSWHTLQNVLGRYECALPGSVIWTKLDEADQYGQLVSVGHKSGRPVSALSYGPGLGNSLCPAKEVMLWRMLFKQELPGAEAYTQKTSSPAKEREHYTWSHA